MLLMKLNQNAAYLKKNSYKNIFVNFISIYEQHMKNLV